MTPESSASVSDQWLEEQAALSLDRIWPRIRIQQLSVDPEAASILPQFEQKLQAEWPRLFTLLFKLYGTAYDFFYHLEKLASELLQNWLSRSSELRELDTARQAQPDWFQSGNMLGAVAYVDLFAGDLNGLRSRIPYLKEWGITYLHLMPLFEAPRGENDGGYAVSSYRHVNPDLGTMDQLRQLAAELRAVGISLILDFVFNHTSDEHEWARRAKSGESPFREYYLLFPDRTQPDAYERTLREIFPTTRRGNFTWNEKLGRWVWTTFHSFQWDLNYSNMAVFRAMAGEMLFLANAGVEVLRLDAVAFIWKRLGTTCENQPEAHWIIQAMNAVARIAAPSLLFKSEAIVHPDEVIQYIGKNECQLSYNPLLMALLWESLATRQVKLLAHSMRARMDVPEGTAWVNYVRCHDDIGWTFDDADARSMGIDPFSHRRYLNEFYTGKFPGSFASGVPFQENPVTGDARVCGMMASLAGLEKALQETPEELTPSSDPMLSAVQLAINRALLLHGMILCTGGIPLIYLNDEAGVLNDYAYRKEKSKRDDSRWVHRVKTDWDHLQLLQYLTLRDSATADGKKTAANATSYLKAAAAIFIGLKKLIAIRASEPAFAGNTREVIECDNAHVLALLKRGIDDREILICANFSERKQIIRLRHVPDNPGTNVELIAGKRVNLTDELTLKPYQLCWFR